MLLDPATMLPERVEPYLVLMVVGFLLGIFGHLMRSRLLTAVGIALIFLAALLLPLAVNLLGDSPEPPGPRPPFPPGA